MVITAARDKDRYRFENSLTIMQMQRQTCLNKQNNSRKCICLDTVVRKEIGNQVGRIEALRTSPEHRGDIESDWRART